MAGVLRILVLINALFVPPSAATLPHTANGVKEALVHIIARDEALAAQSLFQTSATLQRWGAQHRAQLEIPVRAAEAAAESLLQASTAQEVPVADARRSFRKVRSHMQSGSLGVVASQAALEVEAVRTQPEKWASAPSLLQTSEAEGGGGSLSGVALGTQHAIVHGLPLQMSDSSGSSMPLNVIVLLGIIVGLAALMLQLSSCSQPSITGQLGGRKSQGLQLQGPMQESGACATDRGS